MKSTFKYITLACLYILPIFALIMPQSMFFPFITGKALYFRILVEIGFASWIILALIEPKYRPKFDKMTILVILFAFITLLSDLFGVNPLGSIWSNFERMEGWITIVHLCALYLMFTNVLGRGDGSENRWKYWLWTSLTVAFAVGIYGLVQYFGGAAIHQGGTRIDSSLGNSAYMAVYMLFHAIIALYLFVKKFKDSSFSLLPKIVYGFLFILFAFEVYQTSTRGTIIGLGISLLFMSLTYTIFGKGRKPLFRWLNLAFIIVVIVAGALIWTNKDSNFVQKSETLRRLTSISWNDTTSQARGFIWPMALKGFTERPILGWGQENFNYIFNANYNPKMYNQEQWFDRAHSVFLDWLVAGGILGFLLYISLYIVSLYTIAKSKRLDFSEKIVLSGLFIAYGIHNIFVFDNISSYIMFFAVISFVRLYDSTLSDQVSEKKQINKDIVEYIALPIVLVLFVFVLYMVNVRIFTANTRLITALSKCYSGVPDLSSFQSALSINSYLANQEIREQYLNCGVRIISSQLPVEIKQNAFDYMNNILADQIQTTPLDARIYVLGGTSMLQIGQMNVSIPLLSKGLSLSPNKQSIKLYMATALTNIGQTDQAVQLFKEAYESAPQFIELKKSYISGLVIAGREAEARKLFPNDEDSFMNEDIANYYMRSKQYERGIEIFKYISEKDKSNIQKSARLSQAYYESGDKDKAIQVLKSIQSSHPELKEQIESTIKQFK